MGRVTSVVGIHSLGTENPGPVSVRRTHAVSGSTGDGKTRSQGHAEKI